MPKFASSQSEIAIIYQDEDIVVINKPPGISAHGGDRVSGPTVTDFLIAKFPEMEGVGDSSTSSGQETLRPVQKGEARSFQKNERPGIVHRLDKNTSGVMVTARNQKSFLALKELFQKREVEKIYRAIACGKFKEQEGTINLPIGRLISDPRKRAVNLAGNNKKRIRGEREAITEFKVLRQGEEFALVEIKPKTGRMHQIRVHLAAIHHPVACDIAYGGKKVCCPAGSDRPAGDEARPVGRQLLHAFSLSFNFPAGRKLVFEADPPVDFNLAVKKLL